MEVDGSHSWLPDDVTRRAPTISVVIPVFDGERYLAETLEAVAAQTRPVDEIIVVDDGSTDRSAEVASQVAPEAVVLRQPNRGASAARNAGVAASSGDLLAFCDADDVWHPTKTELQLGALVDTPSAGYSITRVVNFVSDDVTGGDGLDPSVFDPRPGWYASCLVTWRSFMDAVGLLDEDLRHADKTGWFLAARDLAPGVILDEVLVRRRLHTTNTSRLRESDSLDEYFGLLAGRLRSRRTGSDT